MNDNCVCSLSIVYINICINKSFGKEKLQKLTSKANFKSKLWKWVKKVEIPGYKWTTFKKNNNHHNNMCWETEFVWLYLI